MLRKYLIFIVLFLVSISCYATTNNVVSDSINSETYPIPRYKLYPTKNIWIFLKLDTQTGKIWMVQYSINNNAERGQCSVNTIDLTYGDKTANGRFSLTPTNNMYNFILLDQQTGAAWQVQWSTDSEHIGTWRICYSDSYLE